LLTGKIFLDKANVGTAKIVDAIGQVFANVDLAVRVCNLIDHLPVFPTMRLPKLLRAVFPTSAKYLAFSYSGQSLAIGKDLFAMQAIAGQRLVRQERKGVLVRRDRMRREAEVGNSSEFSIVNNR
jgi:hypothetical protein